MSGGQIIHAELSHRYGTQSCVSKRDLLHVARFGVMVIRKATIALNTIKKLRDSEVIELRCLRRCYRIRLAM